MTNESQRNEEVILKPRMQTRTPAIPAKKTPGARATGRG